MTLFRLSFGNEKRTGFLGMLQNAAKLLFGHRMSCRRQPRVLAGAGKGFLSKIGHEDWDFTIFCFGSAIRNRAWSQAMSGLNHL